MLNVLSVACAIQGDARNASESNVEHVTASFLMSVGEVQRSRHFPYISHVDTWA